MDLVRLKNGSEEPRAVVDATMEAINSLRERGEAGVSCAIALRYACSDKEGFGSSMSDPESLKKLPTLLKLGLVDADGVISPSTKNIVQSALENHGLDTVIVSPILDETVARADGSKWSDSLGDRSGRKID